MKMDFNAPNNRSHVHHILFLKLGLEHMSLKHAMGKLSHHIVHSAARIEIFVSVVQFNGVVFHSSSHRVTPPSNRLLSRDCSLKLAAPSTLGFEERAQAEGQPCLAEVASSARGKLKKHRVIAFEERQKRFGQDRRRTMRFSKSCPSHHT